LIPINWEELTKTVFLEINLKAKNMKKTTLFIMASAVLAFVAMPVIAQKTVTLQEVQQKQQNQTVSNPTSSAVKAQSPIRVATPTTPVNQAAAKPATPAAAPVPLTCTWDVTDYDFGKNIVHMKPASATFNITNAGKEPITITQVQPSCGCTAPKYTKEPIKPGEKGEVVLTYDAKVSGFFSKSAQVRLNDGQKYTLTIKGEVQKGEATPVQAVEAIK
jgi:hypothetical protein